MFVINDDKVFRKNIKNLLKEILNVDNKEIYENLEIAIFNYAIEKAKQQKGVIIKWEIPAFVQIYTDHLRTILHNLDHNEEIRQKLIEKTISPKDFVFMTHQEWNPKLWENAIEEKQKKDSMKYNKTIASSTDMFICKKCGNNKCTYYEMQTRSADESATIFVTCLTCGKKWRE